MAILLAIIVFIGVVLLYNCVNVLYEYERAVVFTFGRFTSVKGPGLIIIVPGVQTVSRVDLRVIVMSVAPQDVISRDNVSVRVSAVIYFRVVEPEKAILQVENYEQAVDQFSQTTLRSVLGQHELDEMLAERNKLNAHIRRRNIESSRSLL